MPRNHLRFFSPHCIGVKSDSKLPLTVQNLHRFSAKFPRICRTIYLQNPGPSGFGVAPYPVPKLQPDAIGCPWQPQHPPLSGRTLWETVLIAFLGQDAAVVCCPDGLFLSRLHATMDTNPEGKGEFESFLLASDRFIHGAPKEAISKHIAAEWERSFATLACRTRVALLG